MEPEAIWDCGKWRSVRNIYFAATGAHRWGLSGSWVNVSQRGLRRRQRVAVKEQMSAGRRGGGRERENPEAGDVAL